MRILQPAEWSKPRGFSHGVEFSGPGRWVVLAGQTGGDEKGDYAPDLAAQVATALKRIIKLLSEAGAGPEHIVRLTWYLTSSASMRLQVLASARPGRRRWDAISRPRPCSISMAWSMPAPRSKSR